MSDAAHASVLERVSTGQAQIDQILSGGFPAHSMNVIMGSPGTGKTILAQQILFNAAGDRPVVYLSTISEPLSKILTFLQGFEFYDEAKMLESIVYEDVGDPILRDGPEYLVEHVSNLIRTHGPALLVIDSFKAVHDLVASEAELRRLCYRLGAVLSAYDVTTFLVGEYTSSDVSTDPEFAVADGIVQLEREGLDIADARYMRILKLRGSAYGRVGTRSRSRRQGSRSIRDSSRRSSRAPMRPTWSASPPGSTGWTR